MADISEDREHPPLGPLSEAERALQERPGISIRKRLALGFLSLFLLCGAVTAAAWIMLSRLEVKLRFLETADRFTMEIQQARRFEKNYFLYGSNLQDVQEHLAKARGLLLASGQDTDKVLTSRELQTMRDHLERYGTLIARLEEMDQGAWRASSAEKSDIEIEIRDHGSKMLAFALDLVQRERAKVAQTLTLFKRLPLVFLGALLLLSVLIANFLSRQMLGPLGRLMGVTRRIAQGDFTPITPARKYRDEFSNLAVALNTMMRELSQRQDILVQSHKLRAVGTLTAGVAHELNNPINNITLTAEMLKEDYETLSDADRLDMVQDLVTQAGRAQKIVRNLLDFAREGEIKTERLDISELLRGTASLASNQIKLSGAKIQMDIPEILPPIHGDRQSLSQVFLNLLLNALDAVGKGGRVGISAREAKEGNFVQITVSDDGHGIPAHVVPYIFDPFFTTKSKGKGTGLGLSVSLGIVRQHGGDILAENCAGRGAAFTVLLPAVRIPNA